MNTVDIYGDMKVLADIINNEFEGEFVDDTFTLVRTNLFRDCTKLTKVKCHNVTRIGERAFQDSGIKKIEASDFPNVTQIDQNAFTNCTDLTEATLSIPSSGLYSGLFSGCTSLKKVWLPEITTIRANDPGYFNNCTSLEAVYFPKLTSYTGSSSSCKLFNDNCGLEEITPEMFPVLTSVSGSYAFHGLRNIKRIILPLLTSVGYRPLTQTVGESLMVLRVPSCNNAFTEEFYGPTGAYPAMEIRFIDTNDSNIVANGLVGSRYSAPNLKTIILRNTSLVTLASATGRFVTATPLGSGKAGIDIYVHQNLISSYESDTNWSVLGTNGYGTARFHALEGSVYEDVDYDYDIGMED